MADVNLKDSLTRTHAERSRLGPISSRADLLRARECSDRGLEPVITTERVISFILGHDSQTLHHVLKNRQDNDRRLGRAVDQGVRGITRLLCGRQERFVGAVNLKDSADL